MSDNFKDKVNQLGERLKVGGSEVGQKLSARMSSMSFKMKEFFQGPNQTDNLIEEATAETLDEPDWATNLELCDMISSGRVNSVEFIRSIKKRFMCKIPRVQYLTLVLLETFVKNCDRAFSEVAAERVLDEMVKLIDDPLTVVNNRNKILLLIESWGKSSLELRYLPVYEETYKSLIARGIRFPLRDIENLGNLVTPPRSVAASDSLELRHEIPAQRFSAEQTKEAFDVARNSIELLNSVLSSSPPEDILQDDASITLSRQCRESQYSVQMIIESAGDNEALLFEALNVNDEIQKVLSKYEDMKKPVVTPQKPQPNLMPVAVEPDDFAGAEEEEALTRKQHNDQSGACGRSSNLMDDLDKKVFGKSSGSSSEAPKEKQPTKDDPVAH
ncbi:3'(2'),5'-bisphosphate nucleotidase/inositol-1,4-bisphosphate 1-phosphatase [Salvia divinorum]|uniref:3'(2'),5'-bisphosphate nucleotidase/inositol-1,4-bisphosphate 1-phosphatase n=1 Tax=Salvia divinorum TaxID=28513 RepID=A0ABD1H2H0_SALDI